MAKNIPVLHMTSLSQLLRLCVEKKICFPTGAVRRPSGDAKVQSSYTRLVEVLLFATVLQFMHAACFQVLIMNEHDHLTSLSSSYFSNYSIATCSYLYCQQLKTPKLLSPKLTSICEAISVQEELLHWVSCYMTIMNTDMHLDTHHTIILNSY